MDERPLIPVAPGMQLVTIAKAGKDGTIVGRYTDGRVILFDKESPLSIQVNDTVIGYVKHVARNYIVMDPKRIVNDPDEALMVNLENVANSGYYQHAVLAQALIHIIKLLRR